MGRVIVCLSVQDQIGGCSIQLQTVKKEKKRKNNPTFKGNLKDASLNPFEIHPSPNGLTPEHCGMTTMKTVTVIRRMEDTLRLQNDSFFVAKIKSISEFLHASSRKHKREKGPVEKDKRTKVPKNIRMRLLRIA